MPGRYERVEKLASGGMAEVYLAKVQGSMGFHEGRHSLAFTHATSGRRVLKDSLVQAREQQVYRIAMKP